jgi:hypothetical protein
VLSPCLFWRHPTGDGGPEALPLSVLSVLTVGRSTFHERVQEVGRLERSHAYVSGLVSRHWGLRIFSVYAIITDPFYYYDDI